MGTVTFRGTAIVFSCDVEGCLRLLILLADGQLQSHKWRLDEARQLCPEHAEGSP